MAQPFVQLAKLVVAYLVLEAAWFWATLSNMYTPFFAAVQGAPVEYRPVFAPLAYAILVWALWRFVVTGPGSDTRLGVAKNATLLALGIYGVYNLTNLATLKRYRVVAALVDTAWGVAVFNAVGQIAF